MSRSKEYKERLPGNFLSILIGFGNRFFKEIVLFIFLLTLYFIVSYIFSFHKRSPFALMSILSGIFLSDIIITVACVYFFHMRFKFGRYFILFSATIIFLITIIALLQIYFLYVIPIYIVIAQYCLILIFLFPVMIWNKPDSKWFEGRKSDFILFLLPCSLLITYYSRNLEYFTSISAIIYFIIFLMIPLGLFLCFEFVQNRLNLVRIAAPIIVALSFIFYFRPMYSSYLKMPIELSFFYLLLILFIVPIIMVFLYLNAKKILIIFIMLLFVISVINSYAIVLWENSKNDNSVGNWSASKNYNKKIPPPYLVTIPHKKPDIYLLIYDAYANEKMMSYYGIDNHAQMNYLKINGFKIYDNTYSLFYSSIQSMTSTLDWDITPKRALNENNTVNAFLQNAGYKTHLVLAAYLLNSVNRPATNYIFPYHARNTNVNYVYNGIAGGEFKSEMVYADVTYEDWIKAKRNILSSLTDYPKYLYAHSRYPNHSQNSGRCLEDETSQYLERLQLANHEMKEDISAILASKRDAIIIIAGDHGPYLTADCYLMENYKESDITAVHLADRYGMFLAIKWPDDLYQKYDKISILQDVFFAVFAYMSEDEKVLQNRLTRQTPGAHLGRMVNVTGFIKDGIVTIGKDKGKKLYDDIPQNYR